jgi:hypothetical protein
MELSIVDEGGLRVVEGVPHRSFLSRVDDVDRVIEECFSANVPFALLYAENLTDRFFDLSSGEAGAMLQKLRNYGVRLAVVCPAGSAQFSSRIGEMVAEERLRQHFGVFDTRYAAREWLARLAASQPARSD